jgi:hypothetical protein
MPDDKPMNPGAPGAAPGADAISLGEDRPTVRVVVKGGTVVVHSSSSSPKNQFQPAVYFIPDPGCRLRTEKFGTGMHVYFVPPRRRTRADVGMTVAAVERHPK